MQGASIRERLSKFLFTYRDTPQTTTGFPPATLLMGCHLRSLLDWLSPNFSKRVENKQLKQAQHHHSIKLLRTFTIGDTVYMKDFSTSTPTWIPGRVTETTGPLSYQAELLSGKVQFADMWMQFIVVKFKCFHIIWWRFLLSWYFSLLIHATFTGGTATNASALLIFSTLTSTRSIGLQNMTTPWSKGGGGGGGGGEGKCGNL